VVHHKPLQQRRPWLCIMPLWFEGGLVGSRAVHAWCDAVAVLVPLSNAVCVRDIAVHRWSKWVWPLWPKSQHVNQQTGQLDNNADLMHPLHYANQQSNLCAAVQVITFTTAAAVTPVEVACGEQNTRSGHLPIRFELSIDHFWICHEEKFHDWGPIQNCIHRWHDLRQGLIVHISQRLHHHSSIHSFKILFVRPFLCSFLHSIIDSVSHSFT